MSSEMMLANSLDGSMVLKSATNALRSLELVGLKFVMEACRTLGLEPAIMRDILSYASARSIVSMDQAGHLSSATLDEMKSSLVEYSALGQSHTCDTPVIASALCTLARWKNMDEGAISPLATGSPSAWSFSKHDDGAVPDLQSRRVLVVGLGVMGLGMAVALKNRSHTVIGCDIDPSRLTIAKENELQTVTSAGAALESVEYVLFVVETSQQAMRIIDHEAPALVARKSPLTIVVHSTMSATAAEAIQDKIKGLNRHLNFLEIPISGGPARAMRGELLVRIHHKINARTLDLHISTADRCWLSSHIR
jgi:3-hydroxyisobutyrate dehydrogenase-like beta-hydroxyacid dehydrogenase